MRLTDRLDLYRLEYALVRARNRLDFALRPKGDRTARKVFCLGPAKSGTSSLHALFEANGLRSIHSAGNWPMASYDCFSDRGDYRPFRAYDATYPNAVFLLNTRPLGSYLRSLAIHRSREGSALPEDFVNAALLVGQARRREAFHLEVLRHFAGRANFFVVDIERPGSMAFVADRLGLILPEVTHHHKTRDKPTPRAEAAVAAAMTALDGPALSGSRLVLTDQPETEVLADLLPGPENLWL